MFDLMYIWYVMDGFFKVCLKYNIIDLFNEVGLMKSQILGILQDLFGVGFEMIVIILNWVFMYFVEY